MSLSLWSKYSHLLAIGTMKGNVILYNHRNRRYIDGWMDRKIFLKLFLELHSDVLIMILQYFWSKMLFVGTVSILVFSRNSYRTMNYSLGTFFLTGKIIFMKLFLQLRNDVLIMFLQYFWSKMLFVGTVSILVFSRNSNWTMNYSLGTFFLTGRKIFLKLFLELHNDVLIIIILDEWMDRRMDGWMDGGWWMDGWIDRWMAKWMERRTDGQAGK